MDKWILKGPAEVKKEPAPFVPPAQVWHHVATPVPTLRRSSRLASDVLCLTPDSCIFSRFKVTATPKQGKKSQKPKTPKSAKKTNVKLIPIRNDEETTLASNNVRVIATPQSDSIEMITSPENDNVEMITPPQSDNNDSATTPGSDNETVTTKGGNKEEVISNGIERTISTTPNSLKVRFALKKTDKVTPSPLKSSAKVASKHQVYTGSGRRGKVPKSKLPRFSFHKEADEGEEDPFFGDNYTSSDTDSGSSNEQQIEDKEKRSVEDSQEDRRNHEKRKLVIGKGRGNRSTTVNSIKNASPSIPRFNRLSELGSGLEPGPFPPARRGHLDPKWLTTLRPVERIVNVKSYSNGITVTLLFERSRFPSKVEHYHIWKFPKAVTQLYNYFSDLQLNNDSQKIPIMQAGLAPFVQAVFDQVEVNNKS